MAGFSLDVGDTGASSVQSVAPAATSASSVAAGGISSLARGLFGLDDARMAADRAAQSAANAAKPTESQINRSAFGALTEGLQNLQGVEDPAAVNSAVGGLVASYESQGFKLGAEEQAAILRYTGVNVNIIDPIAAAQNELMTKLGEQPQYLALAERDLKASGKPYKQEDVITQAATIYQNDQADALYLATSKNISNVEFQTTYAPRATRLISGLVSSALQGLQIEAAGGDVDTKSLTSLRANLASLKATLTPPVNVGADEFRPIQAQLDALDGLVAEVIGFDQKSLSIEATNMLEAATSVLLDKARVEGNTDYAIAAAALTTPEGRTLFFTNNAASIRTALNGSSESVRTAIASSSEQSNVIDFTNFNEALGLTTSKQTTDPQDPNRIEVTKLPPAIQSMVTTQPDGSTKVPTVSDVVEFTSEALHDPSFLDRVRDIPNRDRVNLIDVVNGLVVNAVAPKGINDPAVKDAFVGGVGQITATITTTDRLLDPAYLSSVFSSGFFSAMDRLKVVDKPAYDMTQARVQNALLRQYNNLVTTYSGRLADSNLAVGTDGKITINKNSTTFPLPQRTALQSFADINYNGDLVAMIADRGRKVDNPTIRGAAVALYQDYAKIKDFSAATKVMSNALRRSGVQTNILELSLSQGIETQAPTAAPTAAPAPAADQANPVKPDWAKGDAAYNSIPSGSYYIDPDGVMRVKG